MGPIPRCSSQAFRRVRSVAPTAPQTSIKYKGLFGFASRKTFKSRDNNVVAASAGGRCRGNAFCQTFDQRVDQLLLECPNHFGCRKKIGHGFGHLPNHFMLL